LTNLRIGEWDRELGGVWSVDVDWGGVWWCIPLHAPYDFLAVVAVVDVRCYHLFVGVFITWDVEGVETERGGVVGKVGESWVVVLYDLFFSMVVDRFFYHLDSCCGASKTLEHGYKARVGGFSDHIGGGNDDGGWCGDVDGG